MRRILFVLFSLFIAMNQVVLASNIKKDESVIFFPSHAYIKEDSWVIPIHGWIFEKELNSFWRKQMMSHLPALLEINNDFNNSVYQQRTQYFLVDNERGKTLQVSLLGQLFDMNPSAKNGHFNVEILLSKQQINAVDLANGIEFKAVASIDDSRLFKGKVHFISQQGVSVISDIDDTIKVSNVKDKKALLENTFFKPFQAVDGMVETYQLWQQQGAVFHYISASPWHLYPALSDFINEVGFPEGSYNLKHFRMKDETFFNLFSAQELYKKPLIENILRQYPQRKFILVGDAGEQDPEIFASIAREFPLQVLHVFIRDLELSVDAVRYQKTFYDIPKQRWSLFKTGNELPKKIKAYSSQNLSS